MTDAEILGAVCGPRAAAVVQRAGGIRALDDASPDEIGQCGLSLGAARKLAAAIELHRRIVALASPLGIAARTPRDVVHDLKRRIGGMSKECFVAIGLDARQVVRHFEIVAIGSLSSVEVHPREFFRPLIRSGVHSAIAAHNHPSGDASPSDADRELTRRLNECGDTLGVPLLDHLVVTRTTHTSFAALGLL